MFPTVLLGLYFKIRYGLPEIIEIFGIKGDKVIKFLEKNGTKILDIIQEEQRAGKHWVSFRYCVTKE